MRLFWGKVKC